LLPLSLSTCSLLGLFKSITKVLLAASPLLTHRGPTQQEWWEGEQHSRPKGQYWGGTAFLPNAQRPVLPPSTCPVFSPPPGCEIFQLWGTSLGFLVHPKVVSMTGDVESSVDKKGLEWSNPIP
jgi:hypothetical protein